MSVLEITLFYPYYYISKVNNIIRATTEFNHLLCNINFWFIYMLELLKEKKYFFGIIMSNHLVGGINYSSTESYFPGGTNYTDVGIMEEKKCQKTWKGH